MIFVQILWPSHNIQTLLRVLVLNVWNSRYSVMIWPFFLFFLQADGSGGGGGRKNRRGLTTMSLNESRGSAGGGDRGSTGGVSTWAIRVVEF